MHVHTYYIFATIQVQERLAAARQTLANRSRHANIMAERATRSSVVFLSLFLSLSLSLSLTHTHTHAHTHAHTYIFTLTHPPSLIRSPPQILTLALAGSLSPPPPPHPLPPRWLSLTCSLSLHPSLVFVCFVSGSLLVFLFLVFSLIPSLVSFPVLSIVNICVGFLFCQSPCLLPTLFLSFTHGCPLYLSLLCCCLLAPSLLNVCVCWYACSWVYI